jgi:hypothetical protein
MRITVIVERPLTLEGSMGDAHATAVVNFSGHTVSLVAIITHTAALPPRDDSKRPAVTRWTR